MLVEIRIGIGKRKLRSSILNVEKQCRISSSKIHRVPHITLYGTFTAADSQINHIKDILESVGKKYSYLPYLIDGVKWKEGEKGKFVYFNIVPSDDFKNFREELSGKLLSVVPLTKSYDKKEDFLYHSTLAYKLNENELKRVWSYANGSTSLLDKIKNFFIKSEDYKMKYFYLPMYALRATLLNNQAKIICEYDFLQKRLLSRQEALSRIEWQKTLKLFRIKKGIEEYKDYGSKNYTEDKKTTYVISDLHLDHSNIINYCARPFSFSDVEEMNNVLTDNWNNTVRGNPIYFLGDLSFGRNRRPASYWLKKLKGEIHFIIGNHEEYVEKSKKYTILAYKNHKFLLVHDPDNLPIKWNEWIIHGHKHNSDIKNYPFINGEKKTINVSAELVNYKPVSLDDLISLKLDSIKRMDAIDSNPERK